MLRKGHILVIFVVGIILYYPITADAKSYNIYIGKMPAHWEDKFGNILYDATEWWKKQIPGTEFYQVEQSRHADFMVQWASVPVETEDGSMRLGYYTTKTDNDYGLPYIQITLGFFEDGKWNLVDSDYALEITKHEIGHAIGFGHSDDRNNIMYPSIYNYKGWLKAKESGTILSFGDLPSYETLSNSEDAISPYYSKALELQEKVNSEIENLKNSIYSYQDLLYSLNYESPEGQDDLDKALQSLDSAKEKLANAEWAQTEGENLIANSNAAALYKYAYSQDMINKALPVLTEIDLHLNSAEELEKSYQESKPKAESEEESTQEKEKTCFLFWCW